MFDLLFLPFSPQGPLSGLKAFLKSLTDLIYILPSSHIFLDSITSSYKNLISVHFDHILPRSSYLKNP